MKTISHLRAENGFTLMELMVASVVTTIVLGGAVALTSQVGNGYRRQLEDSAGEQEARYAMEWIGRYLRGAGNNPFKVTESDCPGVDTEFFGIIIDPNGDGVNDDITLQSDSNPPDKKVGGDPPDCDQTNEHVTISFCSQDNFDDGLCGGANTITFLDNAVGDDATTRTDSVIDNLQFVYLDSSHTVMAPPIVQANIFYVQTQITIRTRTAEALSGNPVTRVLTRETRVRGR
jgi:prepilin-type N-terminal cleavage/methylation domain-containing protein